MLDYLNWFEYATVSRGQAHDVYLVGMTFPLHLLQSSS